MPNEFDEEIIFDIQFRLGWVFLVQGKRKSADSVGVSVKLNCNGAVEATFDVVHHVDTSPRRENNVEGAIRYLIGRQVNVSIELY
jgi:hypothetical protein